MASILAGIDKLVDEALGITDVGREEPHYQYKESWIRLIRQDGAPEKWRELVRKIASQIESNWDRKRSRGRQNWRHKKQLMIAEKNKSPEKRLEKRIAQFMDSSWSNQVPVCSGVNDGADGKRSVDLARFDGSELELIELKVESHTALYAAIEIPIYGLVYRFSRRHRKALGYTREENPLVFEPSWVALRVLAPAGYYCGNPVGFKGVEEGIQAGLAALSADDYRLTFCFERFDDTDTSKGLFTESVCKEVIARRGPVVCR